MKFDSDGKMRDLAILLYRLLVMKAKSTIASIFGVFLFRHLDVSGFASSRNSLIKSCDKFSFRRNDVFARKLVKGPIGEESKQFDDVDRKEQARLRRIQVDEGEIRRQARVREDSAPYLALLGLQFLPLINDVSRFVGPAYFLGVAGLTVFLAARQETIDKSEVVSEKSALLAPIGASFSLLSIYTLLKFGIDPTSVYSLIVTIFGALSISDIGVPLLRNVLPESFSSKRISIPKIIAGQLELEEPSLPLDGLTTLFIGFFCAVAYWLPTTMAQKFIVSNVIAWSIAMVSLGSISLGSYQTAAILLGGLFIYDCYFVFGTDVMMTVATKVEAPVKFIYPAQLSDIPREYPFSVLGLGDIVVPGLFVRFMNEIDGVLQPSRISYLSVSTVAYTVALLVCFIVNYMTNSGQPALFYLDPALIGSTLIAATINDQLREVWNFRLQDQDSK